MQVLGKDGFVELIDWMGSDNTVVTSARVSVLGESKGEELDRKLINYMMENRHTSPFEQVEFRFLVSCPLIVARQWMRHRTASYNEVSRRYTSEEISFYFPETLRLQASSNRQSSYVDYAYKELSDTFINRMKTEAQRDYALYIDMIDAGFAREQARLVLPQSMFVKYYFKIDLHNLFNFIELRSSPHAQYEIQVYANAMAESIKPIIPMSYDAWENKQNKLKKMEELYEKYIKENYETI